MERVWGDPARSRAVRAARHARRLYPGPLGRLVADELRVYAEGGPAPDAGDPGLAESVIAEVLDRPLPRRAGWPPTPLGRSREITADVPGGA